MTVLCFAGSNWKLIRAKAVTCSCTMTSFGIKKQFSVCPWFLTGEDSGREAGSSGLGLTSEGIPEVQSPKVFHGELCVMCQKGFGLGEENEM